MAELGFNPLPEHDPNRRQLIDHFLNLVGTATKRTNALNGFPGTMPATLSRRFLQVLCANDYVCLEKSDGTRYMLMALQTYVFLIDRRMKVYVIEPNPNIMFNDLTRLQDNTILDGELTLNLVTQRWEYLIYDAIVIDGDMAVANMYFRERMQLAETYVAGPRTWQPATAGLLRLRIKDFYERNQIRSLFQNIKKSPADQYIYRNNNRRDGVMCNENDGIIFAPVKLPYQIKNSNSLLKWKPPHLNSVDFELLLKKTFDQRRKEPSVKVSVAFRSLNNMNVTLREVLVPYKLRRHWANHFDKYNNSIAEFAFDKNVGEYRYIRQREDKDTPNFQNTLISTIETIAESIEREELTLKLEKTQDADQDQMKQVEFNQTNTKKCTYVDDYFDLNNVDYVSATPISLTPPPSLAPNFHKHNRNPHPNNRHRDSHPPPQHHHYQPNHHASSSSKRESAYNHSNSNGDSARRRDDQKDDTSNKKGQNRAPVVYNDDV